MLYFFGRGHLGKDLELKVENKTGKYYRVAIAFNRVVMTKNGKVTETVWGSGLLHEAKTKGQMEYLVKGAPVTFVTNKGWIRSYTQDDGTHVSQLDLGFLQSLEAGVKFPPRAEAQSDQHTLRAQVPAQQAPVQQAPVQQMPQQQAPQQQSANNPFAGYQMSPPITLQQGATYPGAQDNEGDSLPF